MPEENTRIEEVPDHRLIGREVAHVRDGRRGTCAAVFKHISKVNNKTLRTVAHMRPLDASGIEWEADPKNLQPISPFGSEARTKAFA